MIRFLQRRDFIEVRSRGSHHIMQRDHLRTVVPVHGNRPLKIGTLKAIIRDTNIGIEDLRQR